VYDVIRAAGWAQKTASAPLWLVEMVRERPKPKRVPATPRWAITERELGRHLAARLSADAELREAVGRSMGGRLCSASPPYVDDLICPQCGDREVWYYLDGGPARCHHRNSCGWTGTVDALRRQGQGVRA